VVVFPTPPFPEVITMIVAKISPLLQNYYYENSSLPIIVKNTSTEDNKMLINDEYWMSLALEQARLAEQRSEVPVGAVLVSAKGVCLAKAYNQTRETNDPCAHAEILAIRQAAQCLNNYRLLDTTLYVTLEPCPMCAAAMVHARIGRLVFASRDWRAGAAGTTLNLFSHLSSNHRIIIDEGVYAEEAKALLQTFFATRR
jgi:tRNA(adenine34) deaminase